MNLKAKAVYEIRVVRTCAVEESAVLPFANSSEKCVEAWNAFVATAPWFDAEKECVVVFCLNRKNRILAYNLVSIGSATSSLAHPREILRSAIVASASAFVMLHNHPSGDPAPSAADLNLTRIVREAAKTVEIDFLDHVVIGKKEYDPLCQGHYSFRNAGLI